MGEARINCDSQLYAPVRVGFREGDIRRSASFIFDTIETLETRTM